MNFKTPLPYGYPPTDDSTSDVRRFKNTDSSSYGIFGMYNKAASQAQVKDGTTNTIMVGEMQRIVKPGSLPYGKNSGPVRSKDGWAVGGLATTFSTGIGYDYVSASSGGTDIVATTTDPMAQPLNNSYFLSPGSAHVGGAYFSLGDGSARFVKETMNPRVFALLGSMADYQKPVIEQSDITE